MKAIFINNLVPNETITGHFLVIFKEIRQKKTGEPYLSLVLADRTGEIEAKMWDNVAEVMATFDRDDYVKVKGLAQVYQNKHQFTIHKVRRAEDHEVDATDFFPCSKRDPMEMSAELEATIASIGNEHLRKLLEAIFADEKLAAMYRRAPAAKTIHHACLGGLIEHVLSLCGLCRMVAAHYPDLDLDLLLTGAILHDIGKVQELAYERSFSYTTAGQLVGHIVLGVQLVDEKIREVEGFSPKLKLLVDHMILSHHGQLEFGSPKVPAFAEALVFHHLDNLDSKVEAMRIAIEKDKNPESEFTGWSAALERVLLKKTVFLNGPVHRTAAVESESNKPEADEAETGSDGEQHAARAAQRKANESKPQQNAPTSFFAEKLKAVLSSETK
jgi:3'-5' exoribonuclease